MKNKKGFTLIELLAVIVILAIIMVIATMQVNKTIKKARQDSFNISLKSLKKQVQQKMAMGEEYLCYNYDRKDTIMSNNDDIGNNDDLFAWRAFNLCGNGKYIEQNGERIFVTGFLHDYGSDACQNMYDISDDYRMWVYYKSNSGEVRVRLQAGKDGKFSGADIVEMNAENIEQNNYSKSKTLEKNLKLSYDGKKLSKHLIKEPIGAKDKCKKENNNIDNPNSKDFTYKYAGYDDDYSYQCLFKWDNPDNVITKLNSVAKNNEVTIKQACEAFTDSANWNKILK